MDQKFKNDVNIADRINEINSTQIGILEELKMMRNDKENMTMKAPGTPEKLNFGNLNITEFPETPVTQKQSVNKLRKMTPFGDYFKN
jgi:hypothetical protein